MRLRVSANGVNTHEKLPQSRCNFLIYDWVGHTPGELAPCWTWEQGERTSTESDFLQSLGLRAFAS